MRFADFILLFKKIAVGLLVAAIPLTIIVVGLSLTRTLLTHSQPPAASTTARTQK